MKQKMRLSAALLCLGIITADISVSAENFAFYDAVTEEAIRIEHQPESVVCCEGESVAFAVDAVSRDGLPLYYQWCLDCYDEGGRFLREIEFHSYDSGVFGADIDRLTLTVNGTFDVPDGMYAVFCFVSDSDGNVVRTESACLTVLPKESEHIEVTYQPDTDMTLRQYEYAILSAAVSLPAERIGNLSYQWYSKKDDNNTGISSAEPLYGETKPYIRLATGYIGSRRYLCVVTNEKNGRITVSDDAQSAASVSVHVYPKERHFTDISAADSFYQAVCAAQKNGIINGKSDTLYCPDDELTVVEAITVICRLHQLSEDGILTLVNGRETWYSTYVDYASARGWTDTDMLSEPDQSITVGQFRRMLLSALSFVTVSSEYDSEHTLCRSDAAMMIAEFLPD